MTRDEVKAAFYKGLAWAEVKTATLDECWHIGDLGLDSLDAVEIVMILEEETCTVIDDEAAEKIFNKDSTIGQAINFLHNLTNK